MPKKLDPKTLPLPVQTAYMISAIGECLMAWATAEAQLYFLFTAQMVHQSENPQRYIVAGNVWSAIISFETKMRVLHGVIDANIKDSTARENWALIYNYVTMMVGKRNEVAHGTIVNVDDKEIVLQPFQWHIPHKRKALSLVQLKKRTADFVELHDTLAWISLQFSLLVKPCPKMHQPTPDLVLRLQKQAAQNRAKKKHRPQSSEA